jgi:DNA (cytosine-5)-methyltransferase 1
MKLKLLDLFSGIGGFSLGLESTGYFETIAFVEKDKFCQQVLQKNFKDTPIESEVRNVKGDRYAADIVTGGFPCQPFSVAGKRRGTDDDRYLWDETIRIIRECKPRWFIGENVEGIINIQEGVVLRQVQDDLEKEGFQVQCLVIPASGIGAWHQRKRVWILAYSEHNGSHRSKGNETIESSDQSKEWVSIGDDKDVSNTNSFGHRRWSSKGCTNERWSFLPREQEGREMGSETSRCDVDVLNTNSIGLQRRSIQSNNLQETSNSTETTNTSSKEQYTWWQAQSKLCGVPNGISYELDKGRSNRIKSLGNSIVPLIARQLGIAIMKAEQDG